MARLTIESRRLTLTANAVRYLKPGTGFRAVRAFDDGKGSAPGLMAQATRTGARAYYFVYWDGKTVRYHRLGAVDDLDLADARAEVQKLRALRIPRVDVQTGRVSDGIDPAKARRQERREAEAAKTFADCALRYVTWIRTRAKDPKKSWANDSRILLGAEVTADLLRGLGTTKARRTIRRDRAVPIVEEWAGKRLAEITRGDVHALLDKIEARAPIQCNRTLSCLKALFNYAVDREWIDANPAARITPRGQERERVRPLTEDELRALWAALDDESRLIADVIRTLILTGQRSGEVFGMKWSEIKEGWWNLPGVRTKNGCDHRVWLGPTASAILERRRKTNPEKCPFVFPSNRVGGGRRASSPKPRPITTLKNAVARLVETMNCEPWVPHDLRTTCRTWLSDLGVPPHVKDRVTNHISNRSVGDKHYDGYAYDAETRAALDRWDQKVAAILKSERIAFNSWEADVQKVKDAMYAETRPANVVAFSRV